MSLANPHRRRRRPARIAPSLPLAAILTAVPLACEESSSPPPPAPVLSDTPRSSLGAARRSAEDLQERIAEHQRQVIEQIDEK